MPGKGLKIAILTSEAAPFAKAGGLGDVTGSLPKALGELGVETKTFMPRYKFIDPQKWGLELIMRNMVLTMPHGTKTKISVWRGFFPNSITPIYFIDIPRYFPGETVYSQGKSGRENGTPFIVFTRAALEVMKALDWQPNVIHCHDWMTSVACKWLHTLYKDDPFYMSTASVLTIHNLFFQGKFAQDMTHFLGLTPQDFTIERSKTGRKRINVFASGIEAADMFNTVSPTYAREIITKEYGAGLHNLIKAKRKRLSGILNGIDYAAFNPIRDHSLNTQYSIKSLDKKLHNKAELQKQFGLPVLSDVPLVAIVSRLSAQKGLDLIDSVIPDLMDLGAQFIILGSGPEKNERIFLKAEKKYPKQVAAKLTFDANLAQTVYAGADMLLMPSKFEPMGLSQIIAMCFGTVPIVRKTGGLADTVKDGKTGFVFKHYDVHAFIWAIRRAVGMWREDKAAWRGIQERAMKKDFSWTSSAKDYVALYRRAIKYHADGHPII